MKRLPGIAVSRDGSGARHQAELMVCEECDAHEFLVFSLHTAAGEHAHLQCARCSTSYCNGKCTDSPAASFSVGGAL